MAREKPLLADVAAVMLKDRLGCVPIVDEQGHLVGIVTESDFLGNKPRIRLSAYPVPVVRDGAPVGIVSRHDLLRLLLPEDKAGGVARSGE